MEARKKLSVTRDGAKRQELELVIAEMAASRRGAHELAYRASVSLREKEARDNAVLVERLDTKMKGLATRDDLYALQALLDARVEAERKRAEEDKAWRDAQDKKGVAAAEAAQNAKADAIEREMSRKAEQARLLLESEARGLSSWEAQRCSDELRAMGIEDHLSGHIERAEREALAEEVDRRWRALEQEMALQEEWKNGLKSDEVARRWAHIDWGDGVNHAGAAWAAAEYAIEEAEHIAHATELVDAVDDVDDVDAVDAVDVDGDGDGEGSISRVSLSAKEEARDKLWRDTGRAEEAEAHALDMEAAAIIAEDTGRDGWGFNVRYSLPGCGAVGRAYLNRRIVIKSQTENELIRKLDRSASRIQGGVTGRISRQSTQLHIDFLYNRSSLPLQASIKAAQTRKELAAAREATENAARRASAALIQAGIRGYRGRVMGVHQLRCLLARVTAMEASRTRASTRLYAAVRRRRAQTLISSRHRGLFILQALVRGRTSRIQCSSSHTTREEEEDTKEAATEAEYERLKALREADLVIKRIHGQEAARGPIRARAARVLREARIEQCQQGKLFAAKEERLLEARREEEEMARGLMEQQGDYNCNGEQGEAGSFEEETYLPKGRTPPSGWPRLANEEKKDNCPNQDPSSTPQDASISISRNIRREARKQPPRPPSRSIKVHKVTVKEVAQIKEKLRMRNSSSPTRSISPSRHHTGRRNAALLAEVALFATRRARKAHIEEAA